MSTADFHEHCNAARTKFAQYCSEPLPTDPYIKLRWVMSGAHLMLTEQMDNVYKRAGSIPKEEEQDFAYFAWISMVMVEQHHDLEEKTLFPMMEPQLKTDVREEHAAFSDGIKNLDEYLKSVMGVESGKLWGQIVPSPGKERLPYDGAKVKCMMEEFAEPLFTHLSHEIDWLSPENVKSSGVTPETIAAIGKADEAHVKTELDPFTCLIMASGHIPPYCHFPDMPWVLLKILIPWVFWWKNRRLWKYLPAWSSLKA